MKLKTTEEEMDFIKLSDLNHYNYSVQPKLNGIFASWDKRTKRFTTKGGLEITTVPHINKLRSGFESTKGELYFHGLSFQKINRAVMSGSSDSGKIEFHPFGKIKSYRPKSAQELSDIYYKLLADGYEGMVLTDDSGHQWKVKPYLDIEATIIGFNPGSGKNKATFGSLALELSNGKKFSCAGIKDEDRQRIWAKHPIGEMVTVIYSFLSDDGVPVSPRFKDCRFDMSKTRGGFRAGAGRKEKPATERRDIRKLYRWTQAEHEAIQAATNRLKIKESELIRLAVANLIKSHEA